jgi:hypothetical protein
MVSGQDGSAMADLVVGRPSCWIKPNIDVRLWLSIPASFAAKLNYLGLRRRHRPFQPITNAYG